MSDSDVEDCFELVEYMTNANKLDYIDFFENNLRKWFLNNAENTNDSNRSELVDFCKIKDNTFQLKCHIYPSLKNKSFDKSEFNLEDILNLSSNLFLCQPFLYHPDPNDETKFDISYNYEANNYHRWMGFPVILELSSENQNQEKKNVILVEDLTKKEVKEKKVSHNIDPEAISQLLDTTKQVLKKLKLYNIPLVLSNGVQSKKNFEGLIYITLDDNATKSTERHEKEFIQAYIYSNASSINPTAFSDLEKVVDFYKDLSRRHFKGKEMQQYLGCKLYISGEFLYQINIPSDPKWSEIKMSYCQKPKNLGQTKSKNGSISKRISFGTVIETTLQNSLSFIDKEVHIDNHNLQWGPTCDPLRSFQILASFPQSEYSSDLELTPSIASYIHIYAQFREPKEEWLLLSRNLKDIINSWSDSDSNFMFSMENEEISHVRRNSNTSINISSPLNYSKYSISKLTEKIIHSLFNEVTYTCTKSVNFRKSSNLDDVLSTPYLAFNFFSSRAVPYQSFLWKLIYNCLIMVSTSDDYKKLDLNSILRAAWNEIVRMLRSYWENKTIIPNVNTPHNEGKYEVDLRFNILHQKVSMLNYCIDRSNKNFFQTPKNKNKIKEADKSNSNSSSFPSNFRRLSKREPISDLSHDPSPKGQFVKGDISSLQSFWNDKIQTEQKETNSNDINNQLEENLGSLSISSKSCKSLAYNALQGSPELVSPPSSYPKDSIDSYTEDIKYHSQNISEKESSFEKKSFPVPVNKNGHSHKVFNQSVVRENSLAAESFVQLHCPSSISSYNSVSDIVFASASPKVNSIGKQSSNVMNNEPQGRLKVLESCRLLKHDEPIYIPITQDPGVMSEDMLLDQAQLFEKLGTSETGARRRAQLQGAQLLSDMEAFKAANPKSCLIDFVRWHSPRDWVVGDKDDNVMTESRVKELNGKLSARMENPDNLWQELWAKAKPIPVYLQKPLFDYMSEGEKALHYIENISIEDLYHLLLPTIFLITYDTLLNSIPKEHFTGLKHLQTKINSFGNELMGFPWQHQDLDYHEFDNILDDIKDLEVNFGRAISLINKLGNHYKLIELLLNPPCGSPVLVKEGDERESVMKLFNNTRQNSFIPPLARFEPTLAPNIMQFNFPPPLKRELIVENRALPLVSTHQLNHGDNWHRVYFSLEGSNMRVTEMFSISNNNQ